MRYKQTTTVLKDVGTEKKQPTSLYNWTLQGYTSFREIREGSVKGLKAHRFQQSTLVRDDETSHDDPSTLVHPDTGELWLNIHDNFKFKKIANKNWYERSEWSL